jgi:hypothetical protein
MSSTLPHRSTSSSSAQNGYGGTISIDWSRCEQHARRPSPVPAEVIEKVRHGVPAHLSPEGKLLNLYIWGSRFYMNHSTNSDYDLVAIVTGTLAKARLSKPPLSTVFSQKPFLAAFGTNFGKRMNKFGKI